ncbi:hypothetical protein AcW1_001812 [Taiwanofungus camphoratus]|nr:hypothetical protein AcV5_000139 [Antrodia cinnamomea]KAI0945636.1 hypothetical protein AcW1_001812 [Antrodia cinnamomea]
MTTICSCPPRGRQKTQDRNREITFLHVLEYGFLSLAFVRSGSSSTTPRHPRLVTGSASSWAYMLFHDLLASFASATLNLNLIMRGEYIKLRSSIGLTTAI